MATPALRDPLGYAGITLKGTWVVDTFIAQGGFGAVYRGRHARTHRDVAIKFLKLPPHLESAERRVMIESFEREARILAKLPHAATVEVLDLSSEDDGTGAMWMVLEWVHGETLEQLILRRFAAGERWAPAECLELLRPVLVALSEAHASGIVHRDLKPANIMVVRSNRGEASTRLLDFGIAKLLSPEEDGSAPSGETETSNQMPAVSWRYASPEQAGRKRTGPWTDVHAMALIITELVSGRCPYGDRGAELLALMQRAIDPRRPTPAALNVDVAGWEPVLARAMSLEARERYADAARLLEALDAALPSRAVVGGVVQSGSPSAPAPTGHPQAPTAVTAVRFRRPLRLPAIAMLAVLAVGVGAFAVRRSRSADVPVRGSATRSPSDRAAPNSATTINTTVPPPVMVPADARPGEASTGVGEPRPPVPRDPARDFPPDAGATVALTTRNASAGRRGASTGFRGTDGGAARSTTSATRRTHASSSREGAPDETTESPPGGL